jgi:hypothetical protein
VQDNQEKIAPKVKSLLEVLTNIAILVVCCLLVYVLVTRRDFFFHRHHPAAVDLKGMVLPSPPGYSWSAQGPTLVLALRVGCRFCAASMPFYKRLTDLEASHHLHAHLLAYMPDDPAVAEQDLHSYGIDISGDFGHSLDALHVSGTPTLLLVDPSGKIENAWVGELPASKENEVVAALTQ